MCASPKADFRYTTFSKLVISYNLSFSLALKFKNKQMSQNKFSVFVLTAERNSKRIVDLSLWCLNRVNLPYYLAVALWYKTSTCRENLQRSPKGVYPPALTIEGVN